MSLETAVAMLFKERRGFYALLETISDADLHRRRRLTTGQSTQMRTWMRRRWLHDAAHAQDLAAWRQQLPEAVRQKRLGPKYILRALLLSARKEFLLTADMISEAERTTLPVCGVWTLKDLLGHLTDWAKVGVDGLQQLAEGQAPEFDYTIALNFDEFNNANAAVRKDQSWDEIWTDFKETHHQLLHLLHTMPEAQLTREFTAPWQRPINGYLWTTIWFGHDQEHAHDIRHALKVSGWPKRLLG
jgi:hypothetical protein